MGGKLVDGTGAEPVENSLVLVEEDGKISYAGPHEDVPADKGYEVIDATGKTVMPGLIDTHLHFSGNLTDDDTDWVMQPLLEKQAVAVKQAYDCLTHGLTTVCEIGRFGIHVRDCINNGVFPGPRVYATGLGFCRTAGHGDSHHCSQLENKESHPWGDQVDGPGICARPSAAGSARTPMPSRSGLRAAASGAGTLAATSITAPRRSRPW